MTYMDKILKEFGVERQPLVRMDDHIKQPVHIVNEHYEVLPYVHETKIDMHDMKYGPYDVRSVIDQNVNLNVDEILKSIAPHIDIEVVDDGMNPIVVRSSINIGMKKS